MLSIAICDDNAADLRQEQAYLVEYLRAHPDLEGQVFSFSSGEGLLDAARARGGFDLYVLDVVMPEMDGIQAGFALRTQGERGEIIYLTNSIDFAADSYDVHAFFYLLTPEDRDKLFGVLDSAVKKLEQRWSSAVVVHTAAGSRRILLERIRFVERVGRYVRYFCTDGTVDSQTIRMSFREAAAPLLADRRFYLCGASFVLNFQYVAGVQGQTALLDDGQAVTLPRTVAAEFKKAWGKFWLEGNHT